MSGHTGLCYECDAPIRAGLYCDDCHWRIHEHTWYAPKPSSGPLAAEIAQLDELIAGMREATSDAQDVMARGGRR